MMETFETFKEAWQRFEKLNREFPEMVVACSASYPWTVSTREKEDGTTKQKPKESRKPCLYVISDIEPYKSPLGTGVVGSRRERREELKRHNCREVDPSEFKPTYTNERFTRKHGLKVAHD